MLKSLFFKIAIWLLFLGIIGFIVLYVLEFQYFSNTFGVQKLIVYSFGFGLAAGIASAYFLTKNEQDEINRYRIWVACIVGGLAFSPLFGSLGNRLLSPYEVRMIQYQFLSESSYAASRFGFVEGEKVEEDGYFVYIIKDGKMERLKSKVERFKGVPENAQIDLPVKKGFFGFQYVVWD